MTVNAVDRCLALLEALADAAEGLPLGVLAERIAMPKSATHRLLATLLARGWVTQDPASQNYGLSLRLPEIAFRNLDRRHLPDVAQTVLDRLAAATGEYCRLALVENGDLVWVARAQGATQGLRYDPAMGREIVLHATATGKAWLATLSDDDALRVALARGLGRAVAAGPNAVTTAEDLLRHLKEGRRQGYALAIEEGELGAVALAMAFRAAPDADAPVVGTLSVAGPLLRMGEARRAEIRAALAAAVAEMEALWALRRRQMNNPVVSTKPAMRAAE